MTNRPGGLSPESGLAIDDDASLAIALADLASVLDMPTTPDIATAVLKRLASEGTAARPPRLIRPWSSLRVSPAIAAAVPLVVVALLVVAGVAAAIGFGLPGLRIIFTGPTPAPSASSSGTVLPSPARSFQVPLDLGTPTTIAEARASVTFNVFVPAASTVGEDGPAVFLDDHVLGGAVVLAYPPGNNLPAQPTGPVTSTDHSLAVLVTESRGSVDQGLLGKVLGAGTAIEPTEVNGQAGYWISGSPHNLVILDSSGQPVEVTLREVGDVLVWVQGGTLLRIESPLGLAATLRIAESMR